MSFTSGLFAHCSGALSVGSRIHPVTLPQGAVLPALVYQVIPSDGPLNSHSDAQSGEGASALFNRVRVQFGSYARSYEAAEALSDELMSKLNGFHGLWGDVSIGSCLVEGPQDDHDKDLGIWWRLNDALIQYQSSAAVVPGGTFDPLVFDPALFA